MAVAYMHAIMHHALAVGQEPDNFRRAIRFSTLLLYSSGSEQVVQAVFLIYTDGTGDIHYYN